MRFRGRSYLSVAVLTGSVLLLLKWLPSAILRHSTCEGVDTSGCAFPLVGTNPTRLSRREKLTLINQILDGVDEETPLYADYDPKHTRHFTMVDDTNKYFTSSGDCLTEGTTIFTKSCICKEGWHGASCSIPDIVREEQFMDRTNFRIRKAPPRRLIYAITFNMEFEMLEFRFGEVGDLIDVLLVVESSYTGFGNRKPLYLLDRLRKGFLKQYQHKIVHLFVDYFPKGKDPTDGKYTDFYLKDYAGVEGLQYVHGLRDDDIFVYADADELHRREVLLFLKMHDGYPEPVGAYLRRNVFGFFWTSGTSLLGMACSMRMLYTVYKNHSSAIRGATSPEHRYVSQLKAYGESGFNVQMWQIGNQSSSSTMAGWHCSWCFDAERVRTKLLSAFNYDFPRWGNYPEKTDLKYIKHIIQKGVWFDDISNFKPQFIGLHSPYAPGFALRNSEQYFHILFNPYRSL